MPEFSNILNFINNLSFLTGIPLTLYNNEDIENSRYISTDRFLSEIRKYPKGEEEYNVFLRESIRKSVLRNDISIVRGPARENHFFLPVTYGNNKFVIAGGAIYYSLEDFRGFYHDEGRSYGFLPEHFDEWSAHVVVKDMKYCGNIAKHIQSVANLHLVHVHEANMHKKRYRLIKTIFSLISDIDMDKQAGGISAILSDILIFLLNIDSMSVVMREHKVFSPLKTAGRLKDYLQSVSFREDGIVSQAVGQKKPVYTESMLDILKMGLSEEITSVYLFPVITQENVTGILVIFNSPLSREDADIIFELSRIAGLMFRVAEAHNLYDRRLSDIDILNIAANRLNRIKEPEILYESIVDTSVHLTDADRCSLMLLEDDDTRYLTVKAAKGINKRLMKEIRIKAGEGIAGRVFQDGKPLMMEDIGKSGGIQTRKNANYRTGSFICLPLKIGEKTIGVLNISDKATGEYFSEEDLALLRSFASYASIALERSIYYSLADYLRELSITDPLTGLFNRRYFEERFFEELQRSERHNLTFSFAMIDIDDFKLFNDTEGHLAGDEILRNISNIAKESLRVIDIIARFGGEEFAVIMPQTDKEEAFLVAERIRTSVREKMSGTWKSFPKEVITVSIGVASFPYDGHESKELINNADKALYLAKKQGKDRTISHGE